LIRSVRAEPQSVRMPPPGGYWPDERRSGVRFQAELALEYSLSRGKFSVEGCGRTVDVSSSGLRFKPDQPIPGTGIIQLSIAWPASLDGKVPLRLFVVGELMRHDGELRAVRFIRHEFRTTSRTLSAGSHG